MFFFALNNFKFFFIVLWPFALEVSWNLFLIVLYSNSLVFLICLRWLSLLNYVGYLHKLLYLLLHCLKQRRPTAHLLWQCYLFWRRIIYKWSLVILKNAMSSRDIPLVWLWRLSFLASIIIYEYYWSFMICIFRQFLLLYLSSWSDLSDIDCTCYYFSIIVRITVIGITPSLWLYEVSKSWIYYSMVKT